MIKTLVIAPAWVGDMVMAQSLFKLLKQQAPDVAIDIVAPPSTVTLASRMPEIDQAFTLDAPHGGLQLRARYRLAMKIEDPDYHQAIILPNSWKSALIPWFAAIPERTGWRGEMRYGFISDIRFLDKKKYPLMIQRFCALAVESGADLPEVLPWPELRVDPENQKKLIEKWELKNFTNALVICPGAEYGPSKRWPPEYFADIANRYQQQGGEVWIVGGPKDENFANAIQEKTNHTCKNLVGKTSLTDAIDLLALAKVVLTNDSGLMHIAAAVGTRIVAVYGSTSPTFTPPLTDKATILSLTPHLPCQPCFARTCRFGHYHCLTQLTPEKVWESIEKN